MKELTKNWKTNDEVRKKSREKKIKGGVKFESKKKAKKNGWRDFKNYHTRKSR